MIPSVPLREVVDASPSTRNPAASPDDEFIYVDVAAVDNHQKVIVGARSIKGAVAPSRARKLIRTGDIIVSTVRPNLNAVALVPASLDGQIASTGFCVLRPTRKVLPEYLFYFVRSNSFVDGLSKLVSGAMYPAVSDAQVLDQRLPLPPIDEQRRLAELLSRAEGIVRLRREAQSKAADIIPTLFLDMFGDPATNPKGWPVVDFGALLSGIDSGSSPKCHDKPRAPDEWGVLRLGAVSRCVYDEREHKTLPQSIAADPSIEVKEGDLLIARKNTAELVGASAYVWSTEGRQLLPDLIFRPRIVDPDALDPIYLWKLLTSESKRRVLSRLATGSANSMPNISKERLRTLPIELPPHALQVRFASHVRHSRSLELQQAAALDRAEHVFRALLARVFCDNAHPTAT